MNTAEITISSVPGFYFQSIDKHLLKLWRGLFFQSSGSK